MAKVVITRARVRRTVKSLPFRRRRENKTDYKKRLRLLQAGKPRLVVRFTNRRVIAQIVGYSEKSDLTLAQADTLDLKKFGAFWRWKNNTSVAYLVGLLCGKRASERGIKEAVADFGLRTVTKGGRAFAAAKGAADAGLAIAFSEEKAPSEERIAGKIPDEFKKVKEAILKQKSGQKEKVEKKK